MHAKHVIEGELERWRQAMFWAADIHDTTPGWGKKGTLYFRGRAAPTPEHIKDNFGDEWADLLAVSTLHREEFWDAHVNCTVRIAYSDETAKLQAGQLIYYDLA